MFSANIASLCSLVVERDKVLHQKRLDSRRYAVVRDIVRGLDNRFISALEEAIRTSHSDHGHRVVLRSYSAAEMEEPAIDHTTLSEVLKKTDVLVRVGNRIAPGFFKCHVRSTTARERVHGHADYEIIAHFHAEGFESEKPACCCIVHDLLDGWCPCGGYGVRPIMNPEDEED
jgi:hypothetical protein